jgi:hypothetical protein
MSKEILTSAEAADHLGCAPNTLKAARYTGRLYGVTPPGCMDLGRKTRTIRYKVATLDKWLSQFKEK